MQVYIFFSNQGNTTVISNGLPPHCIIFSSLYIFPKGYHNLVLNNNVPSHLMEGNKMVRDNKASTQKENNNIRIDFNSYVCCVAHIANIQLNYGHIQLTYHIGKSQVRSELQVKMKYRACSTEEFCPQVTIFNSNFEKSKQYI